MAEHADTAGGIPDLGPFGLTADQTALAPGDRTVTLPRSIPDLTLGWGVIRWIGDNLLHHNGPDAGKPFSLTEGQVRFLLHWYAVDAEGQWLSNHGVRRLAKGSGKAEILTAEVPTPTGWTTVGDLRVGDEVFGSDGVPTRVTQLHPVRDDLDSYRVTLSDGSSSVFSGEHLFDVDEFIGGPTRVRRTLSVAEMAETGLVFPRRLTAGKTRATKGGVGRFALPRNPVLELPDADLPIDPYLFGYWLGDGDSDAPRITVSAQDAPHLIEQIEAADVEHGELTPTSTAYRLRFGNGWARRALRELGVLGGKRIPAAYLRASADQRLALLQGLMDSDGTIAKNGAAEFCSCSPDLASGTAELIRSLGYKCNVRESDAVLNGRVVGKRYRIGFKPYSHRNVFRLPRKAERVQEMRRRPPERIVVSIERVDPEPMRCITVAAPDGLYLTGRTLWVTHNSPFAAVLALAELLGPVRVADFDSRVPGGVVGRPVVMPLVQVAATSERQTANTMRVIAAMSAKTTPLARTYGLSVGKTFVDTPGGGRLEQITSSASAAEGAEVTMVVADETEHWVPGNGGPDLLQTLTQNAAKSGSRVLETCNSWVPGQRSVAESTFDAWVDQVSGATRATQHTLYDAVVAPPNTALNDDPEPGELSLSDGLRFVYADCPWVDIEPIRQLIWNPSYDASRARRFYLNQPTSVSESWVEPQEWAAIANPDRKLVTREGDTPGEDVVLFFDGSESEDHTALVGCCMSDGHVFTLGVWAPDPRTGKIPRTAVQSVVESTKRRFNVLAFWADVRWWETSVHTDWPALFKDDLILHSRPGGRSPQSIAWDMRTYKYKFAEACEMALAEIQDRAFTHDGDWTTAQHIANARVREQQGRFAIGKSSPKSPAKVDAAVCVVGARMVYRALKDSPEYEKRLKRKSSKKGVFALA